MSYSIVEKIAAASFDDDFALPDVVAKAAGKGDVTRKDLTQYLERRALEKKAPGETVHQAHARLYVGGHAGPDDPIGAKLFQTLRKMETAFAGRQDDDPVGKRLLAQMIAA
jgi:hypothetical protein